MNLLSQNLTWLLLCAVGVIALIAWQRFSRRENHQRSEPQTTREYGPIAQDPVTGNKVGIAHAITANFEGKTYFFESVSSRAVFQDPARYIYRHQRGHGC